MQRKEPLVKKGVAGMDSLSGPTKYFDTSGKSGARLYLPAIRKAPTGEPALRRQDPRRRIVPLAGDARQAALPQARRRLKGR